MLLFNLLLFSFSLFLLTSYSEETDPEFDFDPSIKCPYFLLTSKNFERFIRTHRDVLVIFYDSKNDEKTSWEIPEFHQKMSRVYERTYFATVDVSEEKELALNNSVRSLPDIRAYIDGLPINYWKTEALLDPENFIEWFLECVRKLHIDPTPQKGVASWSRNRAKAPRQLFFVGNTSSPNYPFIKNFSGITGLNTFGRFAQKNNMDFIKYFNINDNEDHLFLVNGYNPSQEIMEYDLSKKIVMRDLYLWIESNKYPAFLRTKSRDPVSHADIYKEKRPMLFLFVPHFMDESDDDRLADILENVAVDRLNGAINSFFVHLKINETERFLHGVEVQEPSVFMMENMHNKLYAIRFKMEVEGEISEEAIEDFYYSWLEGRAPRHFRNQVLSSPFDQNGIPILTRENFQSLVIDSKKDVFGYFFETETDDTKKDSQTLKHVKALVERSYMRKGVSVVVCNLSLNDIPGITLGHQKTNEMEPSKGPERFVAFSRRGTPGEWVFLGDPKDTQGTYATIEEYTSIEKTKREL